MAGKGKGRKTTRKSTRSSSTSTAVTKRDPSVHGVPGNDYSKEPPVGHVNVGDGSDENPHNIVAAHDWHSTRTVS